MSNQETINEKIARLESGIEWFYGEDFSLDQAIEKYQESVELTREIETDLNTLKNQIEVLSKDFSEN